MLNMKNLFLIVLISCFSLILKGQVSKTVNVTAGGLKTTLTATELSTVSNLTLTGVLDARDFKTMRDDMPVLEVLDINETTIASYSGTDGTLDYSTDYPVNTIPENCFAGKLSLTNVLIPTSVTAIGMWSFYNCTGLKAITIPSLVTMIDYATFLNCSALASVVIPPSVTSIGLSAFAGCSSLISVNIPFSVVSIADMAFSGCGGIISVDGNNPNYSSLNGILFDKMQTRLIHCPLSKTGSFTIPVGVKIIASSAFENCTWLTSITIPSSVTTIESSAFAGCTSLSSIIIPQSVISISDNAFYNCTGLTSITAQNETPINLNGSSGVFDGIEKSTCKLSVPYGSSHLYATADQWKNFTNIEEMPEFNLSSISIIIQSNGGIVNINLQTALAWTASSDKTWLTVSPISGNSNNTLVLTATANTAISSRIAEVTMSPSGSPTQSIIITQEGTPLSVNLTAGGLKSMLTSDELINVYSLVITGTIDARDFKTMRDDMPGLKKVDLSGVTVSAYTGAGGTVGSGSFYPADIIPENAFSTKLGTNNKNFTSIILPETVTSIGQAAFYYCTDLTSMVIPPLVTNIGYGSFMSCSSLVSLTIPSSVSVIDYSAFSNCSSLSSINIPSSVLSIDESAFTGCSGLINVDEANPYYASIDGILFDKLLTTLIHYPISKTESTYNIPSSVTYIGYGAFIYCKGLASVLIPSSVSYIGVGAFMGCTNLTSVNIPPLVTSINAWTFGSCSALTSSLLPPTVTNIGFSAYDGCSSLTSVAIPSSVTTFSDYAFNNCSGLTSITTYSLIPKDLSASTGVFNGINTSNCKLYVPFGSYQLYASANQWQDFTNIIEMPGIALSAKTVTIAAPEGSNATIELTSNTDWATSPSQTWLSVSPSSGNGAGTLTFTAGANPVTTGRTAVVTVSGPEVESQTITVNQNGKDIPTAINKTEESNIVIYPNPVYGTLTIEYKAESFETVSIFNSQGVLIAKEKAIAPGQQLDFSSYASGIYFIEIVKTSGEIRRVKVVHN
jgi:hypothetical protein